MSNLKADYEKLTNEELLKRRALGRDGLSDEAHKVIDEILNGRDVVAPPIPSKSVNIPNQKTSNKKGKFEISSSRLAMFGTIILCLFISALIEALTKQYRLINFIFVALIFSYWVFKKVQKNSLTETELEEYELEEKMEKEGLTELMYCSVKGDVKRVIELFDYGVDVDKQDTKGTTALMYAVSNNHIEIVKLLLANGANKDIKTNKNNTALSLAEKYGVSDIKQILIRN
jgi:hypothetical protein